MSNNTELKSNLVPNYEAIEQLRANIADRIGNRLNNGDSVNAPKTVHKKPPMSVREAIAERLSEIRAEGQGRASAKAEDDNGAEASVFDSILTMPSILTPELEDDSYSTEYLLSRYRSQSAWIWDMANKLRTQHNN